MADRRPDRPQPRRRVGGDGVLEIFVADEQSDVAVDLERWSALARHVVEAEGVRGAAELSVLFVDAESMAQLNHEHMGAIGPTDVLAFPIDGIDIDAGGGPGSTRGPDRAPLDPADFPLLLGDVIVCPTVAAAQAPNHAGTIDDEFALLVTHGILHVLGYDHDDPDEARVMRARERELLERHHWHAPAPIVFRQEHPDE